MHPSCRLLGCWGQARDGPLHPFLCVLSFPALIKLHSDLPVFYIKEYLFCKILVLTLYIETRNREEGRLLCVIPMQPPGQRCSSSQGKRFELSKFFVVIVYCEVSGPMGHEI